MGRPSGPKTRNSNTWTEARFNSFITSGLRQLSKRWNPISKVQKKARIRRGVYLCNGCRQEVPASLKEGRKRVNNVHVDHIEPAVDPQTGFTTWDEFINRLFCEEGNLQVLCKKCHDIKSMEERKIATDRRKSGK